jgi:hypothetical protein
MKLLALALLCFASTPALAVTIVDPAGDFVPSYGGPKAPDLDVTSFSVNYDSVLSRFLLSATFAGVINSEDPGCHNIGVNTGTRIFNFAAAPINLPCVTFNRVVRINKDGASPTAGLKTTISGDPFDTIVLLASLPASTGAAPIDYGFNLWPRAGNPSATLTQPISDFPPDNGMSIASVPESSTWSTRFLGFGLVGALLRRRRVTNRFGQRAPRPA